jgi:hypothetical protein
MMHKILSEDGGTGWEGEEPRSSVLRIQVAFAALKPHFPVQSPSKKQFTVTGKC